MKNQRQTFIDKAKPCCIIWDSYEGVALGTLSCAALVPPVKTCRFQKLRETSPLAVFNGTAKN